jgi:hypothetical protein
VDDPTQINGVFWNVGRADRAPLVAELAAERRLDIVILAESGIGADQHIPMLGAGTGAVYCRPTAVTTRLQVFSRSNVLGLEEVHGSSNGRLTVRRLQFGGVDFLLAAAHLVSKRETDQASQHFEAEVLSAEIRDVERRQGHSRTILVGDLNLNPFEEGVVAAAGLHAMTTKAGVADGSRVVQDKEYPFFYNPMWGLFGDRSPGPAGSLYRRMSQHVSYDWNLFDQLLIRPEAIRLVEEDVELLTRIGETDLATSRGRPNRHVGSDHFPLFFRLTLRNE